MPQFAFTAKDRLGNTVQGTLDAENLAMAANRIGHMGYSLVELRNVAQTSLPLPESADPHSRTRNISAGGSEPTMALTPPSQAVVQASAPGRASEPTTAMPDASQTTGQRAPTGGPTPEDAAAADILRADAQRRRDVEADLTRLGMKPDEIRRLLDASANTTAPPTPSPAAAPRPPIVPIPQQAAPKKKQAQQKVAARAADLQSFAAQLQSSSAAGRVRTVESADLKLPPFRESSIQERERAETLLREVYALRRREKYAEALARCREALDLVPADAAALEMFGDLLQGVARTDEALAAYKRATEADANRSSAERKYGDLLMRQQNWSEPDTEEVPKNPIAAAAFSLLIPGAGQLHNGERMKGLLLLACAALAAGALFFLTRDKKEYEPSSRRAPVRTATVQIRRQKAPPIDLGGQVPVLVCVLFYTSLAVGSAFDAASVARRRRSSL